MPVIPVVTLPPEATRRRPVIMVKIWSDLHRDMQLT